MSNPLVDKAVVITGSGQGIGEAIAMRLAKDGADIGLLDLDEASARRVADTIEQTFGRKTFVARCNVADRDSVHESVEAAQHALGAFDVMINNAGIGQVLPLLEARVTDFRTITDVNIGGVLWGIQAAAASFIARSVRGKIINACSISGFKGQPTFGMYSATKFAVRALTHAAAQEYAQHGITVNGYSPGTVGTPMWAEIDRELAARDGVAVGESFARQAAGITLGRPSTGEDVAAFVAWLAGPDSDYMTGQSPLIDGGMLFN